MEHVNLSFNTQYIGKMLGSTALSMTVGAIFINNVTVSYTYTYTPTQTDLFIGSSVQGSSCWA